MCGLVGVLAKYQSGFGVKAVDAFTQMLYADAIRGWDATGVFGVDKLGNVDIKKMAAAAGHFVSTKNYKEFTDKAFQKYQFMIGHNRKATHGDKKHADAHPFWDKDEKICLVHNGMISNHKEFCKTSTVDSAAICNAIAEGDVDDVIGRIEGAFALIWYNVEEKKMYFVRNASRPLFISESNESIYVASEDSLSYWIAKRNNQNITSNFELKPYKLYSVSLEDRKVVEEREIEIKKKSTQLVLPAVVSYIHRAPITSVGERRSGPSGVVTTTAGTEERVLEYDKIEPAPDTFYFTTSDFKSIADVEKLIHKQDQLVVSVDTYEEVGAGDSQAYKVSCKMLNVEQDFIDILLYVSSNVFRTLNIVNPLVVHVANVIIRKEKASIFVSLIDETDATVTANDYILTEQMWYDNRFPMECDCCNTKVLWKDLPQAEVLFDKQTDVILICEKCGSH